ncbi:L,D-transpeptidase family protein [Hyphomicrobium sp. LHD-15]|uniref:L,D-transpeptidase family protein n=1 Tax=Hyphomicrobium sp. LHD-15 TaxID=3072142 RepID=UPI00280F99EB|nr:L,D-transpeptidase family protein [Hyphomicrobium sp. LHD-15]MDQ8698756.1 L,D-transpeptidase family protein [Hyphomicrobium sp. LHD-15]
MLVTVFTTGGIAFKVPDAGAQGAYGFWDSPPAPKIRKVKRPPPSVTDEAPEKVSGKKSKNEVVADRPVSGPMVINVSLSRQRLVAYDGTERIAESPVSSGRVGYSTPMGVFSVLEKKRMHHSNLYQNAPMPNMQRLTWSGVAMHAGALPGFPASHGCVRLPHGFSKKLFGMTKAGTRVIISRDPVAPISFAHERLFAAYPPEDELVTGSAGVKLADASKAASEPRGSAVSEALGVTTAAAAGVEDLAHPGVRPSYRERRRAETEKLTAEIRAAGYEKADKAAILAPLQDAAQKAKEPLVAARAEAERADETLRKLEGARAKAEREIAVLQAPEPEETGKKKRKNKKAMDPAKREARVAELTEELAELPTETAAARVASEAANARLAEVLEVAKEAEAKRRAAMTELMQANSELAKLQEQERAAKRLEAKRSLPITVFISRSKQRLYARQGYETIFEVEVSFDRPDEPVGTHVFTALDYTDAKTAMKWSAVSIPYDPSRSARKKDKSSKAKQPEQSVAVDLSKQTPGAALDRITIPEDARERIVDVMKPGSSLIISDLGVSNETGEYTDLIASIR